MVFMASEILEISHAARQWPASSVAMSLSSLLDHRPWVGCSPWDLIQPAFMFMVGVALPFSVASRRAAGTPFGRLFGHAMLRALLLVALGIFLRSQDRAQTNFTFEDVLTQIGLGYPLLFLLAWTSIRVQAASAAAILAGYWLAFAVYPLSPPGFDTQSVGVPAGWEHSLTGFAAHWNKNTNVAAAFDVWFLNLFPRERPFLFNGGGYLTLSFIPSLATMIFGLLAGGLLQGAAPSQRKAWRLCVWGVAGIAAGAALHVAGVCPVVKRIWTPSWTLFSAGWVTLFLAGVYAVVDVAGWRRGLLPFIVVGMNSLAMYLLVHVATEYVEGSLRTHLGGGVFAVLGQALVPVLLGAATLAIFWVVLYWMYRRRLFLRL